ncbi:VOC family protein [Occultella glacieicola]|uniref:VOC family protein n=1 Tax=Occultella glacieicola TaxID=2518684 RepID=A0ABY2DZA6_9MICO|nr:VOC family protein [Occultella glacieicola]TDE90024.1 VOC family protein [Occultella glacieicola]
MARLNPYLNFTDNARAALEFYHSVFGGELSMNTFAEFGQAEDPADAEKIMHGQLEGDGGLLLMASDTPAGMPVSGTDGNISVSLSGGPEDDATLRRHWDALSGSGSVTVPLEVAPWGDAFGMCVDGFGINWLVNIAGNTPEQ